VEKPTLNIEGMQVFDPIKIAPHKMGSDFIKNSKRVRALTRKN